MGSRANRPFRGRERHFTAPNLERQQRWIQRPEKETECHAQATRTVAKACRQRVISSELLL